MLGYEIAAVLTFDCCSDNFAQRGDGMTGFRLGPFSITEARAVAEGFGFEWDGILQMEVFRCVSWYRKEIARRSEVWKTRRERIERRRQLEEEARGRERKV